MSVRLELDRILPSYEVGTIRMGTDYPGYLVVAGHRRPNLPRPGRNGYIASLAHEFGVDVQEPGVA